VSTATSCRRCGAGLSARQEYCLDCGTRVARPPRRLHWAWPAALAGLVAAGGAAAAIAAAGGNAPSTIVALAPLRPVSSLPTGAGRTGPKAKLRTWPARNGYTIVLAQVPAVTGRTAATSRARQAIAARLPAVGILASDRYSSLHPGYSVVFSGVYSSLDDALAALPRAARRFRGAYAQQITR